MSGRVVVVAGPTGAATGGAVGAGAATAGRVGGVAGGAVGSRRPGGGVGPGQGLAAPRGEKPVTDYRRLYAPRFFIEADGELASDLIPYVSSFEYEDDEAKIDVLRLTVLNPGLKFADDPRFKEGVRFRVRFGYLDDISDIYNCVITKAKPSFPQSGIPTIQMIAYGLQRYMNVYGNATNHGPVSSSAVAQVIADRYKLDTDIEDSGDARAQNRVQPAGVTDIQYLMTLAQKLNWDCFIKGGTLHFHPKRYDAPARLEFTYFTDETGTLLSFSPDVNMNQPAPPNKTGTDAKTGDTHTDSRETSEEERVLIHTNTTRVGGMIPNRVGGPTPKVGAGLAGATAETDKKVIKIQAAAAAAKLDMKAIKASAEMVGTPRLRAREMIRISGVDQQYSGNWRITHTRHSITPSGGYRVSVTLSRDAGKAKSPDQNKTVEAGVAGGTAGGGLGTGRVVIDTNNARAFGG